MNQAKKEQIDESSEISGAKKKANLSLVSNENVLLEKTSALETIGFHGLLIIDFVFLKLMHNQSINQKFSFKKYVIISSILSAIFICAHNFPCSHFVFNKA